MLVVLAVGGVVTFVLARKARKVGLRLGEVISTAVVTFALPALLATSAMIITLFLPWLWY